MFEQLDRIPTGTLKEAEIVGLFGKDLAEIIQDKFDLLKRAASLRGLTCGRELLVDYNYSVRMVVGSSQSRNTKDLLVVLELLLQSKQGGLTKKVVEFTQEEFTRFFQKLQSFEPKI